MKLLNSIVVITLLLTVACKHKDEKPAINTCANGKQDNGETEIDCGGSCPACYHYPYLVLRANGDVVQVNTKNLYKSGNNWILSASFDTISLEINLGANGDVGIYDITPTGTFLQAGPYSYQFTSGVCGIGKHDTNLKQMSGNFEAYFARQLDTIRIESGQFEYLSY